MAANEKSAEPTYLETGFGELEYRVIDPEICCKCGTCEAFCPRIAHQENRPALTEYDPQCGLCFAYCPRTFLDMAEFEKKLFGRTRAADEPLGIYRKVAAAKAAAAPGAVQDGGAVTALLVQAMKSGTIDCAVVTGRDEEWRPVPTVASTPDEIVAAAGTKYTTANSVVAVQQAIDKGCKKIGFVGTPCQIQALRKVQLLDEPYTLGQEKIALVVGLFCMENFEYEPLMEGIVKGKFGLQPNDIARFEIKKGMFRVITKGGETKEMPIDQTEEFAYKGCGPCFDFASELADISVGSVGSGEGWSTVIVRTEAGEKLYASAIAAGAVEEKAVTDKGLALVKKLAGGKEERFEKKAAEVPGLTEKIRR